MRNGRSNGCQRKVVVQFDKEASQTRDYCVAKNATHCAARSDPSLRKLRFLRMTSNSTTTDCRSSEHASTTRLEQECELGRVGYCWQGAAGGVNPAETPGTRRVFIAMGGRIGQTPMGPSDAMITEFHQRQSIRSISVLVQFHHDRAPRLPLWPEL